MPEHPGTWRGKRPRKRTEGIDLMAEQERARQRMQNTFTCSVCGGTFEKAWTEDEAQAERHDRWGDDAKCDIVCEDCFQEFMDWYRRKEGRS